MRVHPDLEQARQCASAYRVRASGRGFHVWRFWPWSHEHGGWHVLIANLTSREAAWVHLLKHLGLTDETPPAPLPPAITVRADPDWYA